MTPSAASEVHSVATRDSVRPSRRPAGSFSLDRGEVSGAFGDLGTSLPLILALVTINKMDAASIFIVFGVLHILTGVFYRLPLAIQPLKAVAVLAIATRAPPEVIAAAGLLLGLIFLVLGLSGLVDRIAKLVPVGAIRGVQLGVASLLIVFIFQQGTWNPADLLVFVLCLAALAGLWSSKILPPGIPLLVVGVAWAVSTGVGLPGGWQGPSFPGFTIPRMGDFLVAVPYVIPQVPLSLANVVLATSLLTRDLFGPERAVSPRRIAETYGVMNLIAPLVGGVPACHGSGGLAGHYRFGARTGTAPIIIGTMFVISGFALGSNSTAIIALFPRPVLAAMLVGTAVELARHSRPLLRRRRDALAAGGVALAAVIHPFGFLFGLIGASLALRVPEARLPAWLSKPVTDWGVAEERAPDRGTRGQRP